MSTEKCPTLRRGNVQGMSSLSTCIRGNVRMGKCPFPVTHRGDLPVWFWRIYCMLEYTKLPSSSTVSESVFCSMEQWHLAGKG